MKVTFCRRLRKPDQYLKVSSRQDVESSSDHLSCSLQAVVDYLNKVSPEAAKVAKERYSCFDRRAPGAFHIGL